MPKPHTFPTLYNEALQVSISNLKEWEYLRPEQFKSGKLTWSRNGNITGSISIAVNTFSEQPYIELNYKYMDEPRNYKVRLVSIPSNFGKGLIWYFLCPQTKKHCRILYSIDGYFLHREAFKGCMYESQTRSKKYRQFVKTFGALFLADQLFEQLHEKHFKTTYAGKPTKRCIIIQHKIKTLNNSL